MQTLNQILEASVKNYSQKEAIVFKEDKIIYQELARRVDMLASYLSNLGVQRQDKIALLLTNTPEFVIAYYAILKIGAVVVPLKTMLKEDELSYLLLDSAAKVLINSQRFASLIEKIRQDLDCLENVVFVEEFPRPKSSLRKIYDFPEINPEDLAVILYTSGTTGKPKGALLTHKNLVSNILASKEAFDGSKDDRFLAVLPLFHSFGATVCMHLPIYMGASIILQEQFQPCATLNNIEKHKVTVFAGVPFMYAMLAKTNGERDYDFTSLRICVSGGAALPITTLEAFEKRYPVKIYEGIGLSETSPVIAFNPLNKRKLGSVGKPVLDVEIKVVDENGRDLSSGQVGEIIVKGPNVMKGYLNKPDETKEVLKEGWFSTGDIGKLDSDGYLYIVDRKKEMINVRGLKVYPREVEEIIYAHPNTQEVAVIGIKDELSGELPKAVIMPKNPFIANEEEILTFCRERLASFKVPKVVEFRDTLPKTASGKILKRALAQEPVLELT